MVMGGILLHHKLYDKIINLLRLIEFTIHFQRTFIGNKGLVMSVSCRWLRLIRLQQGGKSWGNVKKLKSLEVVWREEGRNGGVEVEGCRMTTTQEKILQCRSFRVQAIFFNPWIKTMLL